MSAAAIAAPAEGMTVIEAMTAPMMEEGQQMVMPVTYMTAPAPVTYVSAAPQPATSRPLADRETLAT
eukprot:CAMPEP_0195120702 /NCGR_PEP_ID=MMETSP0448-20130528/122429_1 /TAXON_ID=66468 /ORGANISM="Heterocapsa triquestra, Strain CCMP 448" /LENGTH=66 /DNA_ID=CAMNT_0040158141 /DNA_START=28 /DNA_END=225 /DNA_ORIENTATION=+